MKPRLLLVALVTLVCTATAAVVASAGTSHPDDRHHRGSYEVWLVDQQDKYNAGAGTLYVFDGRELGRDAARAIPETVDLAGAVQAMCKDKTGTIPVRPHMIVFNGGDDDGPGGNTHAALAFVISGHIAFLDAQTREPVDCIDVAAQAHAAWPTPDQRHLIVANQGGKKLQRISTDYRTETFTLEDSATLDLLTCKTPAGKDCQDPELRPDNAPICSRTTSDGRFTFVTLRGGGMFVVDHNTTPMRIVADTTEPMSMTTVAGRWKCATRCTSTAARVRPCRRLPVTTSTGTTSTPSSSMNSTAGRRDSPTGRPPRTSTAETRKGCL